MTLPAADIVKGLGNTIDGPINLAYGPTIDNIIVFENYTSVARAAVPMLIGNTDYEGGLFRVFVPPESDAFRADSNTSSLCAQQEVAPTSPWSMAIQHGDIVTSASSRI